MFHIMCRFSAFTICQEDDCKYNVFQSAVNGMKQLSLLCLHYAEKIATDLEEWKIAEARRSVKVGPETNTAALLNK